MNFFGPLLAFFLFQTPAHGSSISSYCPDLYALNTRINHCSFNPYFVKAADVCLAKLDAEVKKQTSLLEGKLKANNLGSNSGQQEKVGNQSLNLGGTGATLKDVRQSAEQVRERMVQYKENFMLPGRARKGNATNPGGPFQAWLESFNCHKDNHAMISKYIDAVERKITDLDATLGDVSTLSAKTDGASRKISSGSKGARIIQTNHATGSGMVKKNHPNSQSDITGTREDAQKRKKTNEVILEQR